MAQARFNKVHFEVEAEPCIRFTPEIDFLRGEPGSVVMGDFLDDATLSTLSIKLVKAFLDVGLYESMCWARWGATKWVQNEPRAAADNSYDDRVDLPESFIPQIPFTVFYDMVKKAFAELASRPHMDAVFKRACFLLNTKEHMYSGINQEPVERKTMPVSEFLTAEGKKQYGLFKEGCKEVPDDWEEDLAKEQEWLASVMSKVYSMRKNGEREERDRVKLREALFGPQPKTKTSTEKAVAAKREIEEECKDRFHQKKAKA